MTSRRTRLRPPSPPFLDELYELATTNQIPWQWHSAAETPESFQQSLHENVLVNFAIEDIRNGRGVGLLSAYGANLHHGFCYISMMLHPEFQLRAWPLESAVLFANYLFVKFNLQNLYAETAGPYLEQFKSGIGSTFEVEGRFRNRLLINGERHDMYVLTITRDNFMTNAKEGIERLTTPLGQRTPNEAIRSAI